MKGPLRIRVGPGGSIRLPDSALAELGWDEGHWLELEVDGDSVRLRRIEVDPFEEALKPPDPDAFDRILLEQQQSRDDAERKFEEGIQDPPDVKPEDRPDFWD